MRIVIMGLVVLLGCGDDSGVPDADADSGGDSAVDGGVPDVGTDAAADAAMDAADDAEVDAAADAAMDSTTEAGVDAATDASPDATDAAPDATDAGPVCPLGAICDDPDMNYAFVTSTTRMMGDIGGLAGADVICNDAATAAGLPGTYVAWLSTSTVDAIDRLGTASGWLRTDYRPFAQSIADLLASDLRYPLNIDENGVRVSEAGIVPTATEADGTLSGTETCADWTDSTASRRPIGGSMDSGGERWTRGFLMNCDMVVRIYCFGVDNVHPYALPVVEGRLGWVSTGTLPANAGLAAADALCVAEGVGLTGTPRALLATTAASAISRFDTTGLPWIRPDGVLVWASAAGPTTEATLIAPLIQQFDGTAAQLRAWTGAVNPFDGLVLNCSDWTSTDGGDRSRTGTSDTTRASWFGGGPTTCDRNNHVYCLED